MNVKRNRPISPADDAGKLKPHPKPDPAPVAGQLPLFADVLAGEIVRSNRKAKLKSRVKDAELAELLRRSPAGHHARRAALRPGYDPDAVRGGVVL